MTLIQRQNALVAQLEPIHLRFIGMGTGGGGAYSGHRARLKRQHIEDMRKAGVPVDELEGRITTSLITPYPPGIPLLIPGEVFNRKIVDYLKFAREFAKLCPGFETDIHGLVEIEDESGNVHYYADCVAQPGATAAPKARSARASAKDKLVQVGSDGPFGRTL